jgi:hypothetical protein
MIDAAGELLAPMGQFQINMKYNQRVIDPGQS